MPPQLIVPAKLPPKRVRINERIDALWEDADGNFIIRDFTEKEEADWAMIEDLTEKAENHRIGEHFPHSLKTMAYIV